MPPTVQAQDMDNGYYTTFRCTDNVTCRLVASCRPLQRWATWAVPAIGWLLAAGAPVATQVEAAPPAAATQVAPGSERLKARLFAEYPELELNRGAKEKLSDWETVVRLREFSYRHTAYANCADCDAYRAGSAMMAKVQAGELGLEDAYSFFDAGRGAVLCGDTASLLRQLYTWAGYDAWILNIGFYPPTEKDSAFTHVLVLVRIAVPSSEDAEKKLITIHDPSANLSYIHADGNAPLDYFEMLQMLSKGEAEKVGYKGAVDDGQQRADPITVAFPDEFVGRTRAELSRSWNIGEAYTWQAGDQGQFIFHAPRTRANFERLGKALWIPQLIAEGLPGETIYLHCLPFQIQGGASDGDELLKRAQAILLSNER